MSSGRSKLRALMNQRLSGEINHEEFCDRYEHTYNFEVAWDELSTAEVRIFSDVFDVVAWFASDPAHRQELPSHFKDEAAVDAAVARADVELRRLVLENRSPEHGS